jgi:hypothetical protein
VPTPYFPGMTNNQTVTANRIPAGKLIFGLLLLLAGILTFAEAIHVWQVRHLWRFWPVLLIAMGLAHEIDALRTRRGDGGYILLGIGVWMLVGSQELLGLDYRSAFPLAVVIAGAGVVLHALLDITTEKKS